MGLHLHIPPLITVDVGEPQGSVTSDQAALFNYRLDLDRGSAVTCVQHSQQRRGKYAHASWHSRQSVTFKTRNKTESLLLQSLFFVKRAKE